jgi:hypothetical protein
LRSLVSFTGWFEYVSALGTNLLVDATGKLFRRDKEDETIAKKKKVETECEEAMGCRASTEIKIICD